MKNVAIFGFGLIGKKRFDALQELGLAPYLLVDPILDENNMQYKNINKVPKSKLRKIDYAFICVPHHLALSTFKEISKYAKRVLIEKPMGLNLKEANQISEHASKNSCKVFVGFNYRYLEHVKKLKKLIESGFFGEIFEIDMHIAHGGRKNMEQEWKLKKDFAGGGAAIDPGIHLIDLACYLTDKDLEISYKRLDRLFWETDIEDRFSLLLTSEKTLVKISSDLISWLNTFEITVKGSKGFAKLVGRGGNYGKMTITYCKRWFWDDDLEEIDSRYYRDENSFLDETREFIRGPKNNANLKDGLKAMKLIEKIYSE